MSNDFACLPAFANATTITLPLADTRQLPIVEGITALATIMGSIYILFVAWKTSSRLNEDDARSKHKED